MTESQRFYELFRKVASLEKRISRLEDGQQQLDDIDDPQGWIGEAFKLTEEVESLRSEVNGKLDPILSHLTGLN